MSKHENAPSGVFVVHDDYLVAQEILGFTFSEELEAGAEAEFMRTVERHAALGKRLIRLLEGLDEPRHQFEELEISRFRGFCSEADYRSALKSLQKSPVCRETALAHLEELTEKMDWIRKLLIPLSLVTFEGPLNIAEHYLHRTLWELQRPSSLPTAQIELIQEFLREQRMLRGKDAVTVEQSRFFCSSDAMEFLVHWITTVWERCVNRRLFNRSELPDKARQPIQHFFDVLDLEPADMNAVSLAIQEDATLTRLALEPTPSSAPPELTLSAPPHNSGAESPPSKPKLRNWAIGLEDDRTWWLFHRKGSRWDARCKVSIPGGRTQQLMRLFSEQGGVISTREARCLLESCGFNGNRRSLSRAITDALKTSRSRIRNAISKASNTPLEEVGDPFPHDAVGWRSIIEIGFAVLNSDERLVFYTRDQLSSKSVI